MKKTTLGQCIIVLLLGCLTGLSAPSAAWSAISGDTQDDLSRKDEFTVIYYNSVAYVSLISIGEAYRLPLSYDPRCMTMTLNRGSKTLTVTHESVYAAMNGSVRNMVLPARLIRGAMYVPINQFLPLLSSLMPGELVWNEESRSIVASGAITTIRTVTSENFANGSLITISLTEPLEHTVEMANDNWLKISIEQGSFSPNALFDDFNTAFVEDIRTYQDEQRTEIAFKLSSRFDDYTVRSKTTEPRIAISLREKRTDIAASTVPEITEPSMPEPFADSKVWRIDTVVIDPGHGGKDPGAVGPGKTYEKDVVLNIALELKKLIDKRGEISAVLTRDKDVFVPLHKRAQIARNSGGKLFISLHANASRNRRAKGFEVFFLSAAKTKDAEEVARRENKAVELEEDLESYAEFLSLANLPKDIREIQLDMESSVYLKESQDMCRILIDKACDSTKLDRRGVKQAGFLVMSGTQAFMPSILVEMGFISNRDEEKLLKRASYQKRMAEAIYEAIIQFKQRHERGLFTGG